MFKSCDYCRHRKKKCVVPPASARCSDCEHLDLPCAFSLRLPSLKRRQTSKRIASRIKAVASKVPETGDDRVNNDHDADAANLKAGDCQLRLAGRPDMANKRLFQPRDSADDRQDGPLSMSEQYWRDVHPFWPFVTSEMLAEGECGRNPDFKHCIDLACHLSLNSMRELEDISLRTERLMSTLHQSRPSMSLIAGTLLLCPFVNYDDTLLQKASFAAFQCAQYLANHRKTARFSIPSSMNSQLLQSRYHPKFYPALYSPTSGDALPATSTSRSTYQPRSSKATLKHSIRPPLATITSASQGTPPSSTSAAWPWKWRASRSTLRRPGRSWSMSVSSGRSAWNRRFWTPAMTSRLPPSRSSSTVYRASFCYHFTATSSNAQTPWAG